MDISNKISFDECNGCEPIYESEFGLNGSVKLRFFNGKEFCWLDYYPSNTIQGIWINNPFTVEDAKKQILECLSSSPYLIVSWKKSNIISSVGSFIDLSIIGVPKLYIADNQLLPEWFKIE
jgi:hypothetical protein